MFLHDLCDELSTLGDLYSMVASLGFSHSRVDQFLMSFPNNFPKVVFTTLAAWYTTSGNTFYAKLDALEKAFRDTHKGALFSRISCRHTEAFKHVCSLPRIHLPDADTMDESFGEAVMNAGTLYPTLTSASYAPSSGNFSLTKTSSWLLLLDGSI